MPDLNNSSQINEEQKKIELDNGTNGGITIETGDATTSLNNGAIEGLNTQELNDPNAIKIVITDEKAPIVVLFGPPSCGKTMTMIRLARYLNKNGYDVKPDRLFRPSYDTHYAKMCDKFNVLVNQDVAADSTLPISFMLVEVSKNAKTLCQILEAPGELYFDPNNPDLPFPRYLTEIANSECRKIWTIMVEPNWLNKADRLNYVSKIRDLKRMMGNRDRTVFVYNKIDKTDYLVNKSGKVHMVEAMKNVENMYQGIFTPFKNEIPVANWLQPYRFDFTVFETGDYHKTKDGKLFFSEGPDVFPKTLWEIITNRLKG